MSDVSRHLRRVRRQMRTNLFRSCLGWWDWHRVTRIRGFGTKTAAVLLPGCDAETNLLALLYLDQMLQARGLDNAVVLAHDGAVLKCARLFSRRILKVVPFSRKKAEHLMQYYCLYEFDRRLVIASVTEPYGRNGDRLIGKRGTTKEDVFVIGIYRLYPFERPAVPGYGGDDAEVRAFLKTAL